MGDKTTSVHNGLNAITEQVIKCAFAVSNELGAGFLEKVYENAMIVEMKKNGVPFAAQHEL